MSLNDCCKLPPLPTVLLSNLQSIRNKLDELESWVKLTPEGGETCLLAFMETWLGESDQAEELSLSGFVSPFQLDRSAEKGSVCFHINKQYCNTVIAVQYQGCKYFHGLTIYLHLYYLTREFQQLFFTVVYIHPQANTSAATQLIVDITQSVMLLF